MNIIMTGNVFPFGEGIAYGGERMIYYLTRGLANQGHNIYLFATEGTNVPSKYIKDYVPVRPMDGKTDVYYEAVRKYMDENPSIDFDIYQCNYFGDGWNPEVLDLFNYVEMTWCQWCHIGHQLKQPVYNTVVHGKLMQDDFADLNMDTIAIHSGIPKDLYQFQPQHENYAVWIGKVEGGKAPDMAIKLAKAAGLKIVMIGPPYNLGCFREEILPYIDNKNVFWVRGCTDAQKNEIMSKAKVFISSNKWDWREHFGFVNIEAAAMGVPIIGFTRKKWPSAIVEDKIVIPGKNGFYLEYSKEDTPEQIVAKGLPLLDKIDGISRQDCRDHFEQYFTAELMGKRYSNLYEQVVNGARVGKLTYNPVSEMI